MKKAFVVHEFSKESDLAHSKLENLLTVAYRKKDILYVQNMESHPKGGLKVFFDPKTGKVIMEFKLNERQFLAIGDSPGMAEKKEIKGR